MERETNILSLSFLCSRGLGNDGKLWLPVHEEGLLMVSAVIRNTGYNSKVSISLQIIHCFPQGWVADFLKRALLYYVMKFMVYIQMLKGGLSTIKQYFYLKGNQQRERKRELMAYLQAITSVGGH